MSPASPGPGRPYLPGQRRDLSFDQDVSIRSVQELSVFDRFVFVMSVLERYSDRECALLLRCSFTDILPARIRSVQQISTTVEKSYPSQSVGDQRYVVDPDWLECG
jgi:hypothetical protein